MKMKKALAVVTSLALVISGFTMAGAGKREAEASVSAVLPKVPGLYVTWGIQIGDDGMVRTDVDEAGNTIMVNDEGEVEGYRDQDNPEYLTTGVKEGWGMGFDCYDQVWFDYIADGKVTHVNPSDLTITHLDGTPCEDVKIAAYEKDPRVGIFQVDKLESVKVTYADADINNTMICTFQLRTGFYTSDEMSLETLIASNDSVHVVNGESKEIYFHLSDDGWKDACFQMDTESALSVRFWDRENEKDVVLSGEDVKDYVTITPVSEDDPHHLIYKLKLEGKNTDDGGYDLWIRFKEYDETEESNTWEEERGIYVSVIDTGRIYAAQTSSLFVKGDQYVYPETVDVSSNVYYHANTTGYAYMLFFYADKDGELKPVTDVSKLSFYLSDYDEATEQDIFTKVGEEEIKADKPYEDSDIIRIFYLGGEIGFSKEYAVTYDGAEPDSNFDNRVTIAFGSPLYEEIAMYQSDVISDADYVSEIETDGTKDIDIYAASVDISDVVFWRTVKAVTLSNIILMDEKGNILSDKVKTDGEVTLTEANGRKVIYGEKITIPKGTLESSAKMLLTFHIRSSGGDGKEHEYDMSTEVFIFYSAKTVEPGGEGEETALPELVPAASSAATAAASIAPSAAASITPSAAAASIVPSAAAASILPSAAASAVPSAAATAVPEKIAEATLPAKGTKVTANGLTYKVTAAGKTNTVSLIKGKKSAKSVVIPSAVKIKGTTFKVTQIGAGAFKGYTKLTKAAIGSNVQTIESKAFYGCSKLKTITVKSSVIGKIGSKAFTNVPKKATAKVPSKKKAGYKKLLKNAGYKGKVK